ncbi:MAG: hypothetical protein QGG40_10180 [Myxococcota bacterium]|jgi:hypothetical protein|nr:hypothetical protein [Myxococcota bacterium]
MPNGGSDNCSNCRSLRDSVCTLRDVFIEDDHYTTCMNFSPSSPPRGPIYSICCVVIDNAGSYPRLPWLHGKRVYSCGPQGRLCVAGEDGEEIGFAGPEEYLDHWRAHAPEEER